MAFLYLVTLFLLPFLLNLRFADAGCCCCCCPSCCCKPIIIKLPPPPVKLCPCCCNCCCCKPCCCCCCPCCCCGGGGGRKKRSVVDLMAKKFSDVLLPRLNQDAMIDGIGGGCGGAVQQQQTSMAALSPLHALCSQIPPSQRGPACQQLAAQQFPLGQNIFNQQQAGLIGAGSSNGGSNGEYDCQCASGCPAGGCTGACNNAAAGGTQCNPANCAAMAGQASAHNCPGAAANSPLCAGGVQMPGNYIHQAMNSGDMDNNAATPFNYGANFVASPCGGGSANMLATQGRKKRSLHFLRKQPRNTTEEKDGSTGRKEAKREVKSTQNQSLVFRNNLEFVVRQSPPTF